MSRVNINNCTPVIKQYFELYKEYTKKFGEKTAILMCVGSFYECYGIFEFGNIHKISDVLGGMSIVKKNKSKEESEKNPLMMGFPDYSLDRHITKLIANGWTVVRVDQFDQEFKGDKERKVTQIYSASTYVDNEIQFNNYLVGIDYEIVNGKNYIYFIALELSTGGCKCIDMYDTQENTDNCLNNFERHIAAFNPTEIVITETVSKNKELYTSILSFINTDKCFVHSIKINNEYSKLAYQNIFFTKVFGSEEIGLESYPELKSTLIFTIQFAYEHDPNIIQKLNIPEIICDDELLNLNNDAIHQLYLVPMEGRKTSLFDIVNFTSTNIGGRLLKERLLRPTSSIEELTKRYSLITDVIEDSKNIKKILSNICDIEKKHRKIVMNKLSPDEFSKLQVSYTNVLAILNTQSLTETINNNILKSTNVETITKKFTVFYNKCESSFNFEKMEKMTIASIDCNIFKIGIYTDIDELQTKIDNCKIRLNNIRDDIIEDIGINDCVKIMYPDKEDYYFETTVKRAEKLKKNVKYNITNLKSCAKITTTESVSISNKLKSLEREMAKIVSEKYIEFLQLIITKYKNLLKLIVKIIAQIDVAVSSAICATKYAYYKPTITSVRETSVREKNGVNPSLRETSGVSEKKSFIKCENIRHPIIERDESKEYIGNDICIGNNNEENYNSMLLYGVNTSGKSSLIRAIGCNLVLAQAGLYVPSNNFEYYPYKEMVCKISRIDNLFKAESTFQNELFELNTILKKQGINTLILADELASGSESYSASSLVATTIETLIESNTTFIISTHMHEIVKFDEIKTNDKLSICHLGILNGEPTRKLESGVGDELYGLEYASKYGISSEFIKRAFYFRNKIENRNQEILSTKKSRYNSEVYIDKCNRCGSTLELCTHHIEEQHTADKHGIIKEKFHKNSGFNLEVLCNNCHKLHHNS